jgi:hypothetical protein
MKDIKPTEFSELSISQKLTAKRFDGYVLIYNSCNYRIPNRAYRILISSLASLLLK